MSAEIKLPPQGINFDGVFKSNSSEPVGDTTAAGGTEGVANILGTDNVTVRDNVGIEADAVNTNPASQLPELDEAEIKQQGIYDAIDKLLSVLQLETDQKQLETSIKRIGTAATLLAAERDHRAEKIVMLLSLMETLGDRFFVGRMTKNEGAAIAAFAAAIVSMAPEDKKEAAFMFMSAISHESRGFGFFCFRMDSETLTEGLKAMGLSGSKAGKVQNLISEGAFDIAAKICDNTQLGEILGKAETFKETARNLADKFDFFGRLDTNKILEEGRAKMLARELEEFFARIAARAEEDGDGTLGKLIEIVVSNTSRTAEILSGIKGTDAEIASQINEMA